MTTKYHLTGCDCDRCQHEDLSARVERQVSLASAGLRESDGGTLDKPPFSFANIDLGTKPTNPKDAIGSGKLPLELVPDTVTIFASLAYLEGALKYGRFNWRIAGVRASIYRAALQRHLNKWWNGEWEDPKTKVPHLASVIACAGIILDAHVLGKLIDDRPPISPIGYLIDDSENLVAHLKELFKEHTPHQYTIEDSSCSA